MQITQGLLCALISYFKNAQAAIDNFSDFSSKRRRLIKLASDGAVHQQLDMAEKLGAQLLVINTPEYPKLLSHIDDAPPILYAFGNTTLFERKCISMKAANLVVLIQLP